MKSFSSFLQKTLIASLLLMGANNLYSQVHYNNFSGEEDFQYGVALELKFEVQRYTHFQLSLTGGLGKKLNDLEGVYPSLHSELRLYNGGVGSSLSQAGIRNFELDYILSFLVTGGIKEIKTRHYQQRFNPLNFFMEDSSNPLQNPFYNSISLGTNFILSTDSFRKLQYLGVINLNVERGVFQFTYYNDGTPFQWIRLGDGFDRYYTGGGFLAHYGDYKNDLNLIEFSYHKFTGYQRDGFELANHMQIDFLAYKNPRNFYYNQSRYSLKLGNVTDGYGISFYAYDFQSLDNQDLIHYIIGNTYHPDTYRKPRIGLGLHYMYTNFNLK